MSPFFGRFSAALAVFLLLGFSLETAAAGNDSLRLKRDLRACIDKSVASANAQEINDVGAILSACDAELQAFMASITDSTRINAVRFAISGYVQSNLESTTEENPG